MACVAFAQPAYASVGGDSGAFGFEAPGLWHSVPRELIDENRLHPDYLWCKHVSNIPLDKLDDGLVLSALHVKEGQFGGLWKDHEDYPTISCWDIPHDWSASNTFEISIYSEQATGETITIGVLSDNGATPSKDYFVHDFTVDWRGWKTLSFPYSSFEPLGKPAGWQKADCLCFFSKAFRHQPNPCTALTLDAIHLRTTRFASAPPAQPQFAYRERYQDEQWPLNQSYPETSHPGTLSLPIRQQSYFRGARELYDYHPRFNPGYPSFSPDGKAYINAGDEIEWLAGNGKWEASDIKAAIINWAKKQGWAGLFNIWGIQGADPMIRFDRAGDAYVLEDVERLDADGLPVDWKTRCALLLYSRDRMKTWTVYNLPDRIASFEKLDGHNADCLDRPPVILLDDYTYFKEADPSGYILIPEKRSDGSLFLPPPVEYARYDICANHHSGDGNSAVTHGDKVFIVYGWCPEKVSQTGDWRSTMPAIPQGNASFDQHFLETQTRPQKVVSSRDGVPCYVVEYDIETRKASAPVYVGSAGGSLDDHNWPSITVDSKGILYVIMNGHHAPVNYTRTLRPWDISAWAPPEYIMARTETPNLSYATLTCDLNDTLYTVHRSTKDDYDDHLALYRKQAGQPWEAERVLVKPFKNMYKVWYQRMTYDTNGNRLFLTYFADGAQEWYTWDMYDYYRFVWPDREIDMCRNAGKRDVNDTGPSDPGPFSGAMYDPGATDITMLVSDDGAQTWRLATTADFIKR